MGTCLPNEFTCISCAFSLSVFLMFSLSSPFFGLFVFSYFITLDSCLLSKWRKRKSVQLDGRRGENI